MGRSYGRAFVSEINLKISASLGRVSYCRRGRIPLVDPLLMEAEGPDEEDKIFVVCLSFGSSDVILPLN